MDLCIEREDIIRQMQSWIESTVDEELLKPARIFLFSPDLLLDDLPLGLTSDMQAHGNTLVRLKSIADSLGIGTGSIEDESDESTPQVKGQKGLRIVKRFSNGIYITKLISLSRKSNSFSLNLLETLVLNAFCKQYEILAFVTCWW